MNDLDLGTALRDRVAHVHPDLDRLAATSMRAGTRIRRRRTVGVSVAAAAGVAAIGIVAAQMAGDGATARDGDLGFAAQPSASATSTPTSRTPPTHARVPESAPFTVTAQGWVCSEPGDEKFDCANGADTVHLVWRDASSHADYAAGGPDKSADWVSGVHGGIFVTVDGPHARVVGESIRWAKAR